MNEMASPPKPPKHRSPSYPAYDLATALERAKQLHAIAGQHRANVSTVVQSWGYTPKSSKGLLTIATLKKFGLAEDQGRGDARMLFLTPFGRELVYFDTDRSSDDWKQRAQAAAMTPTIHRELWRHYEGHLPTDGVMKSYLVLTRRFSEAAAAEVLGEFRRTLEFAGIGPSEGAMIFDVASGEDPEEQDPDMSARTTQQAPPSTQPPPPAWPPAAPAAGARLAKDPSAPLPVNVNLSDDGWATLQVSARLTKSQWDQLMAVLNAMKPGLTA